MDATPHNHRIGNGSAAVEQTPVIPPGPSSTINGLKSTTTIAERIKKKKKKTLKKVSDCESSSASSNNCSCAASSSQQGFRVSKYPKSIRVGSGSMTRKPMGPRDVDNLGLHLGMSIAAFVAQVLERKSESGEIISGDYLSKICILAVRESLSHVAGNKFDSFVAHFEKSFQSTLMTLRLINESSQNVEEQPRNVGFRESSFSVEDSPSPLDSFSQRSSVEGFCHEKTEECMDMMNRQLVLHDRQKRQSMNAIEKSLIEQTRSNDLKTVEIGLAMKKLQLKERQLALSSDSNLLESWKLSMGLSKASFRVEKFKTQLQDARHVDLLKKCLDFLVAGLIIMLFSLAYGTYVYSHRRITEATEACSPPTESKSWWVPKSMSTFNTGFQLLRCQIQVFSRMLFGGLMIGAIAFLLMQRASASHQTMPVTFILLLLGVGCGYAGKFCIDALGGSGSHWLIYWEALCLLHFFSNIFYSNLFSILNGPITVAERVVHTTLIPYWIRRVSFYATLLVLPLLCGFMPFASPWEWVNHFLLGASDFMDVFDD